MNSANETLWQRQETRKPPGRDRMNMFYYTRDHFSLVFFKDRALINVELTTLNC